MFRRASVITALTLAAALSVPGLTRAADAAGPRVLVIPFTTLNIPDNQQWIGRAVSENIIADLGHANAYAPIAFQGQLVVEDNSTAVSLAHKADAQFVVRGAAQQVDQNIRLTAQMIDARSGDTLTTASVTGPVADLLKLEDQLSAQLDANAASAQQAQTAAQQPAAAQPAEGGQAAGPVTYTPNPAYTTPVYTPTYTPGYSYVPYDTPIYSGGYTADYGYPYYGYGGPIVFFGGSYYSGWGRGSWNHGGYYHGGTWNHGGGWDHGGGGWDHGGGWNHGGTGSGTGGGIHTGGGGVIHTGGGGFSGGFTSGGHAGIGGGHR